MQKSFILYVYPSSEKYINSNNDDLNKELNEGWKVVSSTPFFASDNDYHKRCILLILEK